MTSDTINSTGYHDVHFRYDPGRATVWRVCCRYLQRFVHEQHALLDMGAGYGELSNFFQAREKWALDANPDLVSFWPADVRPLIQSALDPLPLKPSSIGTVVASNFFEHFTIEEVARILRELQRVLIQSGRLIVIQPDFGLQPRHYFDDFTHKTPFTHVGFANLLRSLGMRIVCEEPRFLPFSMNSKAPKWGWLVQSYLTLPYRPWAGQFLIVAEAR